MAIPLAAALSAGLAIPLGAQVEPDTGRAEKGKREYAETRAKIAAWRRDHPELVTTVEIGRSRDRRPLTVVRISAAQEPVPGLYFGGSIHGVENAHRDVIHAVDALLGRKADADVRELLATRALWAQPMINPDGVVEQTRGNARDVDLNRNFGFRFGENWRDSMPGKDNPRGRWPGPWAFSEPESRALRDFLIGKPSITVSLDVHRSARLILMPFLATEFDAPDDYEALWRGLDAAMSGYDQRRTRSDVRLSGSGYTIDWIWAALGVRAFTWECPYDQSRWRRDRRQRLDGVTYLLRRAGDFERARPTLPVEVRAVPATLRSAFKLAPFYVKFADAGGLPVLSSAKVSDYALKEAVFLIDRMLERREDIRQALIDYRVRFAVMAHDEFTVDIPEHSTLTPAEYWNRRARGLGASHRRLAVSCGAENLLAYPGDPYRNENILIHEFAHAIHNLGLAKVDRSFDVRLRKAYRAAMAKGLWKDKYAATNRSEYWAEGVQSWFDTNRPPDHDHNHVDTRAELREYDPALAALCQEVFGDGKWRYVRPDRRQSAAHLEGYDRTKAPRFRWPAKR